MREPLTASVRRHFRPDFLNRIDEIVVFRGLDRPRLRKITELLLEQTRQRLVAQDITLHLDDEPSTGSPTVATSPSSGLGRCAEPSDVN